MSDADIRIEKLVALAAEQVNFNEKMHARAENLEVIVTDLTKALESSHHLARSTLRRLAYLEQETGVRDQP